MKAGSPGYCIAVRGEADRDVQQANKFTMALIDRSLTHFDSISKKGRTCVRP